MRKIKIDNSRDSAVESAKWDPNTKALLDECYDASRPVMLLRECFLVTPESVSEKPRVGDCKYPHHTFRGESLVLDRAGVKAAYARAKQQGIYSGVVKDHIDRHRRELGLITEEQKLEKLDQTVEKIGRLLDEALFGKSERSTGEEPENAFLSMLEKTTVNPVDGGQPIPDPSQPTPANPAQPAQNTQQIGQVNPTPTIPVQNVNPNEDPLTNNPVQGPDDRDQDNLDGNARKEQYQKLADILVQANRDNVFGTIFDQDIFKSEYKIVPYEMRYFYRLQNPVSVENGDLRFIPFGTELLEAQDKYGLGKKMFVFATYADKPVFYNMLDDTVWYNDTKLADSFDGFVDSLIQNNGNLNLPEEGENQDANVEYEQNPQDVTGLEQPADQTGAMPSPNPNGVQPGLADTGSTVPADQVPVDLSNQVGTNPGNIPAQNTQAGQINSAQPTSGQPVDLTQQNASLDNDSILDSLFEEYPESLTPVDLMDESFDILTEEEKQILNEKSILDDEMFTEGTAFPNDELDRINRERAEERKRRLMGQFLSEVVE